MKNKRAKVSVVFLGAALLLSPLVMLISCKQLHKTPATPLPPDLTNPTPVTKYKVTITQPANGNIEVSPALPADGKVNTGSELTFTLSAHKGYNVKTLTIGGTTYSVVSNKRITTKVTITKETSISAILEAETKPAPKPDNPPPENPGQGNPNPPNPNPNPQPDPNPNPSNPTPNTKYKVTVTQPANGTIEVSPALPADGKVDKGSELTFTLSANAGYKVKALTIGDAIYLDVTDNTITKKVKIEKETAISAIVEAEASPTPETGIFTDTQGNKVTIAPVEVYGGEIIGYRLTGDIYIEDINSEAFKAKLDTLNGKELYTDSLNINCFTNQNSTITPKEITPEVLTGVLTIGEERKFSAFKLNNQTPNGPIDIKFDSTVEKSFDIKDLNKFSFSSNFKLDNNSNVIVGSKEIKQTDAGNKDITPYPKVNDLLTLLRNETLKDYIIAKDVYITGNVKDLLPKLIGPNKIKETNGGVKFLNTWNFTCPGPNVTKYRGDGKTAIPLEELLEFRKRTDKTWDSAFDEYIRATTIENLILENIDTTQMDEEKLELLHFKGNLVGENIIFKNSNLSKMQYIGTSGPVDITFENTTLPIDMRHSGMDNLILKNTALPEILKEVELDSIPYRLPTINNDLKIFNLKLFDKWTIEEISLLTNEYKKHPPKKYIGPKKVWDKLKLFYLNEATETQFTNADLTGSIQKSTDTLLALLGNSKTHG
ncbi:InlB B-repeat-containing protein [Treponema vincentii]|uniref:InlB B-repeat-containing protein n=1 Tax=Treponema vincentii TaxID=69710 RepID=UPI0020A2CB1E|nr:hypothetical protein [Treponema vincentii]UTC47327.1 hypothetical protein E4N73_09940 [Treponema vincentii]